MTFLEYYLQILIFTAALPVGLGIVVYFCNKAFCSLVGNRLARSVLFGLHVVITPIREFAHLVACIITFHHVSDFCLLNLHDPEGEIGFVEHSYNPKNPIALLGNFLFALLPAALGLFLTFVVVLCCFGGVFADFSASVSALVEEGAGLSAYAGLVLNFFPAMLGDGAVDVPLKIVGCLVLLLLSLGVYVSLDDFFGGLSGAVVYAVLALVLAALTALFDARTRRLVLTATRTFAASVTALYLVVLIFALVALAIGLVIFLIRTLGGEGEQPSPTYLLEENYDREDH